MCQSSLASLISYGIIMTLGHFVIVGFACMFILSQHTRQKKTLLLLLSCLRLQIRPISAIMPTITATPVLTNTNPATASVLIKSSLCKFPSDTVWMVSFCNFVNSLNLISAYKAETNAPIVVTCKYCFPDHLVNQPIPTHHCYYLHYKFSAPFRSHH